MLSELKGVTFASYNIRGVISKVDEVNLLLSRSKIDVLCIQESMLVHNVVDEALQTSGYDVHRLDRGHICLQQMGGGANHIHT